jgi:hypothetical protein
MRSNNDRMLEYLILQGAVEVAGIDSETGEPLFSFTDKLEKIAPEIFKNVMEQFYKEILELWQDGFLDMNIADPIPIVRVTKKAFDEEALATLSQQQKINLMEIIQSLRID